MHAMKNIRVLFPELFPGLDTEKEFFDFSHYPLHQYIGTHSYVFLQKLALLSSNCNANAVNVWMER
jgi:hypothetical protein